MHVPAEALIRVNSPHITGNAGAPVLDLDDATPDRWVPDAAAWLHRAVKFGGMKLGVAVTTEHAAHEEALSEYVHAHYEAAKIAELTVVKQAARFALHFCRTIKRSPSWATMLDRPLAGRTAFVVGAGVSLDAVGPLLYDCQRKGFLISVNSAARACLHHGVMPDLVMCTEALDSASHFEGIDTLVALDAIAHPSSWKVCGKRVMTYANHEHNFLRYGLALGAVPLPYESAVFNAAVSLAHWWGADRVVLLGQNLGFADGRMYAHGSPFDDLRYEVRDGIVYTTGKSKEICPLPVCYRTGNRGGTVESNHSFDAEAGWLDRAGSVVTMTNCSEGGAAIRGAAYRPLHEMLALLPDVQRLQLEPPPPVDASAVIAQICADARRYLAAPSERVPHDFPLLYMFAAPVILMQGRDDQATRSARLTAAMVSGCEQMLEILDGS